MITFGSGTREELTYTVHYVICSFVIFIFNNSHFSVILPCSRVEDVCRCFRSRWERCPANPAVLLASCHGGDQEPNCGTFNVAKKEETHTYQQDEH